MHVVRVTSTMRCRGCKSNHCYTSQIRLKEKTPIEADRFFLVVRWSQIAVQWLSMSLLWKFEKAIKAQDVGHIGGDGIG